MAFLFHVCYRGLGKHTPLVRALAMQSSSRNCSPAPDSVFFRRNFPWVFFSGEVFFHRRRYHVFLSHSLLGQVLSGPEKPEGLFTGQAQEHSSFAP